MTFSQTIITLYGSTGQEWLNGLTAQIQKLSVKWTLRDLTPLPHLSYAYVTEGFQRDHPVILKLTPDTQDLQREYHALKAFSGYGGVRVLNHTSGALLLEQAQPGESLLSTFPQEDQHGIGVVCAFMDQLHKAPIPKENFPTIQEWLSILDKDWNISLEILKKARTLRNHLIKTSGPPVLLHGDLHHGNILSHKGDWIAIDPKGVIGERAYETAAFIRNPIPNLLDHKDAYDILEKRFGLFSHYLQVGVKRLWEWSFVQAVLAWAWSLEDGQDPTFFKRLVDVLNHLEKSI